MHRVRSLIERRAQFENNSNYETFTVSIERCNRNLVKSEDSRLVTVEKQSEPKMSKSLNKNQIGTREKCMQRLEVNNEYESIRSVKRSQCETENEEISVKLHKINHDQS